MFRIFSCCMFKEIEKILENDQEFMVMDVRMENDLYFIPLVMNRND